MANFHELPDSQTGKKAGRPAGWKHMARACRVIPHRSGGVRADKNSSRVPDLAHQRFRPLHLDLEMFRGHRVGRLHRFIEVFDQNDVAVRHSLPDCLGQRLRGGNQHRQSPVMLILRFEIFDDIIRVRVVVRNHGDLGRSGGHVNVHETIDLPLRLRHVGVARPDDLVHLRDRLRAERHRADRLRAANLVDGRHLQQVRHHEDMRVHRPVLFRRRHEDDLLDAGDLGRHHCHVDGGDQGSRAGRDVNTDPLQRDRMLPEHHPLLIPDPPGLLHRPLVEPLDVLNHHLEGGDKLRADILV